MFNLIKMDFYRLFHSKAIKVGMIAAAILAFLGLLLNLGIIVLVEWTVKESGIPVEEAAATFAFFFPAANWVTGVDFATVILAGTNALSLFVSCMVVSSFIGAEQSCGYVKNIAGQISNKGLTILSKFVVTCFVQLVVLIIYTGVSVLCSGLFFSKYIQSYAIGEMIAALGLRFMLFCAINAILLFLCTLTKSHAVAMVIGAIFGIGITNIVYFALNMLLSTMKIRIDLTKIMPDGINGVLSIGDLSTVAVKAIVVAVIFIVAFVFAAMWIFKKRDVK